MMSEQGFVAAMVGIAAVIAMAIAATAGNRDTYGGWRNRSDYSCSLICDEDCSNCNASVQCNDNGNDYGSSWSDNDDCEPFAGSEIQFKPSRVTLVPQLAPRHATQTAARTSPLTKTTPQTTRFVMVLLLQRVVQQRLGG
jgi:hypothetical protein